MKSHARLRNVMVFVFIWVFPDIPQLRCSFLCYIVSECVFKIRRSVLWQSCPVQYGGAVDPWLQRAKALNAPSLLLAACFKPCPWRRTASWFCIKHTMRSTINIINELRNYIHSLSSPALKRGIRFIFPLWTRVLAGDISSERLCVQCVDRNL